jgi:chromosome segregation ATPase
MNSDELLTRMEKLDDRLKSFNSSLSSINKKISELDDRTSGFLNLVREEKNEIANLNSTVLGLGQIETSLVQARADFNRKLDDLEKQRKQEEQIQNNLLREEIKANQLLNEKFREDLAKDFEKKVNLYTEENNRIISRNKEFETEVKERLIASEAKGEGINLITQDVRRTVKQVENLQADVRASIEKQNELGLKLEIISKSIRNDEIRLDEVIANSSEVKKSQLDFLEMQSIQSNDRDRKWGDLEKQFDDITKKIYSLLPELQNQQFNLKQSQAKFEEISSQFERRINELTEMYRLMEDKSRNEWATFKADSEKRWSNISMVVEDRQSGYSSQFEALKERMALVEDKTHEMQEILVMLSTEVQKSMQGFMKMVNGWMDAFGQIKAPK